VDSLGNAKIIAKDINLTGKAGVGVLNDIIVSVKDGALFALSDEGDIALRNVDADFVVDSISAVNGKVTLSAGGNIVSKDANSLITAKELSLIAAGGIGTNTDPLYISTGKLFAQAVDDINISQSGRDLGVDFVTTEMGDITLTASGNVYDASEEEIADGRTLEEKQKDWDDMHLFDEAGWTEDQLVYAVGYQGSGIDYQIDTVTAIPSVVAKKITINSGDAVGTRLQEIHIDISEGRALTDDEKQMIANAPSSQIKIDKENNTLIIGNNKPIVLQGDVVNVEAENGIYLRQTNDNLKSDYIRNKQGGEVRLEVPTSNIEIKDLLAQEGQFNLVFGRAGHSLAYLFNKDVKAMTINPTSAIIPQDTKIVMPKMTIDNSLNSVIIPTFSLDNIVQTQSNLQASAKTQEGDENI
jgi:hypothetical protein